MLGSPNVSVGEHENLTKAAPQVNTMAATQQKSLQEAARNTLPDDNLSNSPQGKASSIHAREEVIPSPCGSALESQDHSSVQGSPKQELATEEAKREAVLQLYNEGRFKFAVRGRPSKELLQQAFSEIFEPFIPLSRIDVEIMNHRAKMKEEIQESPLISASEKDDLLTSPIPSLDQDHSQAATKTVSKDAASKDVESDHEQNKKALDQTGNGANGHCKVNEHNVFKRLKSFSEDVQQEDSDLQSTDPYTFDENCKPRIYRLNMSLASFRFKMKNKQLSSALLAAQNTHEDSEVEKMSGENSALEEPIAKSGADAVRDVISEVIENGKGASGKTNELSPKKTNSNSKFPFLSSRHIGDAKLVLERTKKFLSHSEGQRRSPRTANKGSPINTKSPSSIQKYKKKLLQSGKSMPFSYAPSKKNHQKKNAKTRPQRRKRGLQTLAKNAGISQRKVGNGCEIVMSANMYDTVKNNHSRAAKVKGANGRDPIIQSKKSVQPSENGTQKLCGKKHISVSKEVDVTEPTKATEEDPKSTPLPHLVVSKEEQSEDMTANEETCTIEQSEHAALPTPDEQSEPIKSPSADKTNQLSLDIGYDLSPLEREQDKVRQDIREVEETLESSDQNTAEEDTKKKKVPTATLR